jgi:hypothetical protein
VIFKTVNSKIEKTAYDIDIKNIDLANGHWGSEKKIAAYLDIVENFLYEKDSFDRNMVLHALKLMKENRRIKDLAFYTIPEENKLILLATTEVNKFKEFDTFSREMTIAFKKDKFTFSIVELLYKEADEIKAGTKKLPENWRLEERMTDRINKLKHYQ